MKKAFSFVAAFLAMILLFTACTPKAATPAGVQDNVKKAVGDFTVLIDAGHGFGDPGCDTELINGIEADITLSLAKILKAELEKRDVNVILTHNGEKFPTCAEITRKARQYGIEYDASRMIENEVFSAYERVVYASVIGKETPIDLFISLHINSIENSPQLSQYELYYYENNPYAAEVKSLCDALSKNLDNETVSEATNSEESYTVTRYTDFPSLLLEAGYATNKNDAEKINSINWRQEFCNTVADTAVDWLDNTYKGR